MRFSGRKVMVTGAAGFIGSALCTQLASTGAIVLGVGRSPSPDGFPGKWVQCDLTNRAAVSALVRDSKPDLVFHLAGRTLGGQGMEFVWATLHDNFLATIPLLAALADVRCERIVVSGSLREPDAEQEPTPLSPYAAAKFASSAYARMFHRLYGLPLVIARLFMVYGPGRQDMKKLIPYVADQLVADREACISSGDASFDFVFVDDVVRGLLTLAIGADLEGRTLDIGSGHLTTIADVAGMVANRLGKANLLKIGAIPDRRFEPRRIADTETTAALSGWRAEVTLPDGVDRFLSWHATTQNSPTRTPGQISATDADQRRQSSDCSS